MLVSERRCRPLPAGVLGIRRPFDARYINVGNRVAVEFESGGRDGIRTHDLLIANEEKSKLRHGATVASIFPGLINCPVRPGKVICSFPIAMTGDRLDLHCVIKDCQVQASDLLARGRSDRTVYPS